MFARMPKPDWVYRTDAFDGAGVLADSHGSYVNRTTTVLAGPNEAVAKVLYDSHNYIQRLVQIGGQQIVLSSSARAEGRSAFVHRVQGVVFATPIWSGTDNARFGFRFGVFEQDENSGDLLLEAGYTMWSETNLGNIALSTAMFANDRMWQRERRFFAIRESGVSPSVYAFPFNFPVRRRLNPDQCYAMYFEGDATPVASVNIVLRPFLRTLVSDEG